MRKAKSHPEHVLSLTSFVHKNLQHQADWSGLIIHASPDLPRPLISGIPPEAIYVDPDVHTVDAGNTIVTGTVTGAEQIVSRDGMEGDGDYQKKIDREWVLPVDLREKWTLRQWAEVFDSIPAEPPGPKDALDEEHGGVRLDGKDDPVSLERRRKKRLVMGIVSGDSTVVYYIVHDGIVKPRQN